MRRAVFTVGLVLFVLFDIGLVVLAVRHVQATPESTYVSAPAPDDRQGGRPSDDTTDEPRPERAPEVAPLVMSIADDGTILRAVPGDCEDGSAAAVTLSSDSGATFDESSPELTQALRVSTPTAGVLSVIGADDDCDVQTYTSTDAGDSWQTSAVDDQWYPDPTDAEVVHSPQGDTEPGCRVRFLHPVDTAGARVTCLDGELRGTANSGDDWVALGRLPGARAVVYQSPGNAFALAPADGCGAQSYATIDGGNEWEPVGCIFAEGIQGLAFNGATMVAQVGDEIFQSTDNAQTWSQP